MVNNIVIGGRLTEDAEIKYINQVAICNFTLANNRKYKETEHSTYIEVSLFGSFAEAMLPYLKKGIAINVIGELTQDSWEHEGKHYSKHRIKAKEIDFRIPKKEKPISHQEGENYE